MRSLHVLVLPVVFSILVTACAGNDTSITAAPEDSTTTAAVVTPIEGPLGMVIVHGPNPEQVVCGYDGDELVAMASLETVGETLADQGVSVAPLRIDPGDPAGVLPNGLKAYVITAAVAGDPPPNPVEAASILLDAGITASPRHLVMPADRWKFGPATAATPVSPSAYVRDPIMRGDANVVIVDTGSAPSPPGDMAGAWTNIFTGTADVPVPTEDEPAHLDERYVGHGVFAAGIVRRILPNGSLSIRTAMTLPSEEGPVLDEHSVVASVTAALSAELQKGNGGVVNLSLGAYTCVPDQFPLELAAMLESIATSKEDVVFVAAAGNDGVSDPSYPFWPAGFSDAALSTFETAPWLADLPGIIVGVGALESGTTVPAGFSNTIAASAWAPGTDVVSTYPDRTASGGVVFDTGFASWSGTSFAAPFVSAIIAGCRNETPNRTYRESLATIAGAEFTGPVCP